MDNIGKPEVVTQKRVIDFFVNKLRYNYIGNLKDRENSNIDEAKLIKWLTDHGYTESIAVRAVEELVKAATNLQEGLYTANREVYQLLKYGAKIKENADENETTVYFIDWETPGENLFEIAEDQDRRDEDESTADQILQRPDELDLHGGQEDERDQEVRDMDIAQYFVDVLIAHSGCFR